MRLRSVEFPFQVLLLCLLSAVSARADELSMGLEGSHYGRDGDGGAVSAGFKHEQTKGGEFVELKRTEFPSGSGSLSQMDVDGYQVPSTAFAWSEGVTLGNANLRASEYGIYKARVALDASFDSHWSARVAEQYIKADTIYGDVLIVAVEYRPTPVWGLKIAAGRSFGGTLTGGQGEIAIHYDTKIHLFAGVGAGQSGYDLIVLNQTFVRTPLFEAYGGVSLPTAHGTLSASAESLRVGAAMRETLRFGFTRRITP